MSTKGMPNVLFDAADGAGSVEQLKQQMYVEMVRIKDNSVFTFLPPIAILLVTLGTPS